MRELEGAMRQAYRRGLEAGRREGRREVMAKPQVGARISGRHVPLSKVLAALEATRC